MKAILSAATLICLGVVSARAADTYAVDSSSESRVWLNGDSTLHPYAATATPVGLTAVFDGAAFQRLEFRVPVKELASGEKGLDKNMHKALKAAEHPEISFELDEPAPLKGTGDDRTVSASGKLTIAGVTRPATIEAALRSSGDRIVVTGRYPLLMTDFGVKPPSILGVVKTKNQVTVGFELELLPAR